MFTKVSPASTITTTTTFTMHNSNNTWKQEYDPILQQYYYVNLSDNSISFDSPCEVINHKKSTTSIAGTSKSFFMPFKRSSSYTNEKDSKKQCKFTTTKSATATTTIANKKGSNYSLYRCLSSALSLKKTKSNESTNSSNSRRASNWKSISSDTLNSPNDSTIITPTPSNSGMTIDVSEIIDQNTLLDVDAHIDDDYLLNNNKLNNFKNFAGTNHMRNSSGSYASDESEDEYEEEIQMFDSNYIYNPQDTYYNPRNGGFYTSDFEDEEDEEQEDDIEREHERRELRLQMLKELY
ncbi:conserved hypothetical protein [Candida dubliniensis CD36]|uniref:WW domain-containing protein n=1 Tax=Candida dubliniensis (strain CD36 / ATCC MYA-646 / CBS 7987 / NCPF 3949 / NRRL Y-17841) TaxID=573826 RepID=B9WJI1_CANDC|nr:conserved hypothetical protein [Candida dubliniensis CD36]CAX40625.1 conserved hypothetical protein [Candida dubliniensis CD36]